MRIVQWLLILSLLASTACERSNYRRHADDGRLHVELTRDFIRANSTRLAMRDECDEQGKSTYTAKADTVGEKLMQATIGAFFNLIIEGIVDDAPSTRVVVWPKGYYSNYRQRLYWGENVVYYRACFTGDVVPLIIKVKGDRVALKEVHVPKVLKQDNASITIETSMLKTAD